MSVPNSEGEDGQGINGCCHDAQMAVLNQESDMMSYRPDDVDPRLGGGTAANGFKVVTKRRRTWVSSGATTSRALFSLRGMSSA